MSAKCFLLRILRAWMTFWNRKDSSKWNHHANLKCNNWLQKTRIKLAFAKSCWGAKDKRWRVFSHKASFLVYGTYSISCLSWYTIIIWMLIRPFTQLKLNIITMTFSILIYRNAFNCYRIDINDISKRSLLFVSELSLLHDTFFNE